MGSHAMLTGRVLGCSQGAAKLWVVQQAACRQLTAPAGTSNASAANLTTACKQDTAPQVLVHRVGIPPRGCVHVCLAVRVGDVQHDLAGAGAGAGRTQCWMAGGEARRGKAGASNAA